MARHGVSTSSIEQAVAKWVGGDWVASLDNLSVTIRSIVS